MAVKSSCTHPRAVVRWTLIVALCGLFTFVSVVANARRASSDSPSGGKLPSQISAPARDLVLVDQVGYDESAAKVAIIQSSKLADFTKFCLIRLRTGKPVYCGSPQYAGTVEHWRDWRYWRADFSTVTAPGRYVVRASSGDVAVTSLPFVIEHRVLQRRTLSNILYYFKGQRVSGVYAQADSHLPDPNPDGPNTIDLNGGWYAATGDYGVHLTEGDGQEITLVDWALISSWRHLVAAHDDNFVQYERRLLDGALYGADFLVRDHVPGGSFYQGIGAPGLNKPARRRFVRPTNNVQIIKDGPGSAGEQLTGRATWPRDYEVSFRSGGGFAIADLAAASTLPRHGKFTSIQYLSTAENAYKYLSDHDHALYKGRGPYNVIDDYSALFATVELYKATGNREWRYEANGWANNLMDLVARTPTGVYYWQTSANDKRPSGPAFPVMVLAQYVQIAKGAGRNRATRAIRETMSSELAGTKTLNNPFGLSVFLARGRNGDIAWRYFGTGDLASPQHGGGGRGDIEALAAAARIAEPLFPTDRKFQSALEAFAANQLNWLLGCNPYDTSYLMGSGESVYNTEYLFFGSWKYTNAPGAIINGIAGALHGGQGISFDDGYAETGHDVDWRWSEQFLPHDAWYLMAISALPRLARRRSGIGKGSAAPPPLQSLRRR